MSGPLWYVAVFSIGAGASMPLFWLAAGARGRMAHFAEGRDDIWFHVAAEVVTGLVLLVAGVGMAVTDDAPWAKALSALGLGLLVYSLIQSPGHYVAKGDRRMAATFAGTWLATVPAIVLRFANL